MDRNYIPMIAAMAILIMLITLTFYMQEYSIQQSSNLSQIAVANEVRGAGAHLHYQESLEEPGVVSSDKVREDHCQVVDTTRPASYLYFRDHEDTSAEGCELFEAFDLEEFGDEGIPIVERSPFMSVNSLSYLEIEGGEDEDYNISSQRVYIIQ